MHIVQIAAFPGIADFVITKLPRRAAAQKPCIGCLQIVIREGCLVHRVLVAFPKALGQKDAVLAAGVNLSAVFIFGIAMVAHDRNGGVVIGAVVAQHIQISLNQINAARHIVLIAGLGCALDHFQMRAELVRHMSPRHMDVLEHFFAARLLRSGRVQAAVGRLAGLQERNVIPAVPAVFVVLGAHLQGTQIVRHGVAKAL